MYSQVKYKACALQQYFVQSGNTALVATIVNGCMLALAWTHSSGLNDCSEFHPFYTWAGLRR